MPPENPAHAWALVFPLECKRPIPLKVWLTGEKTPGHLVTFQLCGRCAQCADSTPGRVPLKHWWKLTFLFLSSNNMAFKMLLTLHNSLMVPFTWVSEAVHPNSDPSDSPAANMQGRGASRMDGNVNFRTRSDRWARFVITRCLARPQTSPFPYSSVSSASSWQLKTNTKHRMWSEWDGSVWPVLIF